MATTSDYPAKLEIAYPDKIDRLTTFFRLLWSIPILILISLLSSAGFQYVSQGHGQAVASQGGSLAFGLSAAVGLMIVFRGRYPRWWYDFLLEYTRFSTRVSAYLLLLTDKYPSTVEAQSVKLDIDYPDVERDLDRILPLFKWLIALPHYVVLLVLGLGAFIATIIAWFAILFTGRYPRGLFDFVVGVMRWGTRVNAYAFLLTTDKYPPFSLQ